MAYNILKGAVDGSVDQHGDQEIGGIKVFKNTISASVFYDTDAQSPCATMKDVAITKIKGAAKNSILIFDADTGARSFHSLTFNGDTLETTKNVKAKLYFGSAESMTNIPVNTFTGIISAKYISHGRGLVNIRDTLTIHPGRGIVCDDDGISLNVAANSGLLIKNNKLQINPEKLDSINVGGQNLSDQDLLIVSDVSSKQTTNTTLKNMFDSFIYPRLPKAAGANGEIQIKNQSGFSSSAKLSFDSSKSTLSVDGRVVADNVVVDRKLIARGAVYTNIITVTDTIYEVDSDDYTILCDTENNKVSVVLPPACEHTGRTIIIKKADTNKYRISSDPVVVSCKEGSIDIGVDLKIKMNFSTRTVQSDGKNWWIINSKGT